MVAIIDELNSNGTLGSWGDGPGGYYGQTFLADGPALTELQFTISSHGGTTDYKVYITTWTGSKPGTILWESPLLVTGPVSAAQLVTVAIPNLHLDPGTKYAFILDTSAGPNQSSVWGGMLGAMLETNPGYDGGYAGGEFFFSHFETGTVAGNLALTPIVFDWADLAFKLTFSEVVNSAPSAGDDTASVLENQTVTGNVLANDSDPDAGDHIVVTGVASGSNAGVVGAALVGTYGTLRLNADGSYSYAANSDLLDTLTGHPALQDSFTYRISDGAGGTDEATLTVNISLANDARTIEGTNKADTIYGDRNGQAGAEDRINGGNGDDHLYGLNGADILHGDNGNDRLFGGNGRDRLYGDNGIDLLDGGAGNDWLNGGQGDDRLTGGAGGDLFVFSKSGGSDVVTDYQSGMDRIGLDGITLKGMKLVDVDANGTLDAVLQFSSGSATLLNVGAANISGDFVTLGTMSYSNPLWHGLPEFVA